MVVEGIVLEIVIVVVAIVAVAVAVAVVAAAKENDGSIICFFAYFFHIYFLYMM